MSGIKIDVKDCWEEEEENGSIKGSTDEVNGGEFEQNT